jgi:hypothetical protein
MSAVNRSSWRFMLEHAGYATPPGRAACALELARAEQLLEEALELEAASLEWLDDDFPLDEELTAGATGPFGCVVRCGDELASLWGITLGPAELLDPYARVVAAELASELRDELRQAIGDKLDELDELELEAAR